MNDSIEAQLRLLESFRRSVGHGDEVKDEIAGRAAFCTRWFRGGPLSEHRQRFLVVLLRDIENYRREHQKRLWAFSEEQLRHEFENAARAVLERARAAESEEREVVRRLLWASQSTLAAAFAWLAPTLGFPAMWEGPNTITQRLEFANHFVGYHLLDDGDPGILWIRYAQWPEDGDGEGMSPWVPCPPRTEGAWRVLTPYRERWCNDYYAESYVTPKNVLDILDAHEADARQHVEDLREDGATDEDLGDLIKLDEWTGALRRWMESQDILPMSLQPGQHHP